MKHIGKWIVIAFKAIAKLFVAIGAVLLGPAYRARARYRDQAEIRAAVKALKEIQFVTPPSKDNRIPIMRIISDGTIASTRIYDEHGKQVMGVTSIKIDMDARAVFVTAELKVIAKLDVHVLKKSVQLVGEKP